jgi:hypothetical protein
MNIQISIPFLIVSFLRTFGDAMLKKDFAEDSRKYEMDLSKPINIDCPVRIVHGLL